MSLPTPALLVNERKLRANIGEMQERCDSHNVQLWPHIKTHKCVEIARLQLAAGAAGLTVAKLGEAEALLPSGVRRVFIAYPLVDPETQAGRLRALAENLDELIVAVTSVAQAAALGQVLQAANVTLPVLLAVDTGLGREGTRSLEQAQSAADAIRRHPRMRLKGLFTHEGHTYGSPNETRAEAARDVVNSLVALRDGIDPDLTLWPGCSMTAAITASLPGVYAVRPGTYVFGDLSLCQVSDVMPAERVALTVLSTVADLPTPQLALFDAGSKTFSSDKTPQGISASAADGRDLHLTRLSEEHGWATGTDLHTLTIGERVAWIPAHVCPAVNLADFLLITDDSGSVMNRWPVAARGKNS